MTAELKALLFTYLIAGLIIAIFTTEIFIPLLSVIIKRIKDMRK